MCLHYSDGPAFVSVDRTHTPTSFPLPPPSPLPPVIFSRQLQVQLLSASDVGVVSTVERGLDRPLTATDLGPLLGPFKARLAAIRLLAMLRTGYLMRSPTTLDSDCARLDRVQADQQRRQSGAGDAGGGADDDPLATETLSAVELDNMRNVLVYRIGQKRLIDAACNRLTDLLDMAREDGASAAADPCSAGSSPLPAQVPLTSLVTDAYLSDRSSLAGVFQV